MNTVFLPSYSHHTDKALYQEPGRHKEGTVPGGDSHINRQFIEKVRFSITDTNYLSTSPKALTAGRGREGRDLSQDLASTCCQKKLASGWMRLTDDGDGSHYSRILRGLLFDLWGLVCVVAFAGFSFSGYSLNGKNPRDLGVFLFYLHPLLRWSGSSSLPSSFIISNYDFSSDLYI